MTALVVRTAAGEDELTEATERSRGRDLERELALLAPRPFFKEGHVGGFPKLGVPQCKAILLLGGLLVG